MSALIHARVSVIRKQGQKELVWWSWSCGPQGGWARTGARFAFLKEHHSYSIKLPYTHLTRWINGIPHCFLVCSRSDFTEKEASKAFTAMLPDFFFYKVCRQWYCTSMAKIQFSGLSFLYPFFSLSSFIYSLPYFPWFSFIIFNVPCKMLCALSCLVKT